MEVIIQKNADLAGALAARMVSRLVREKPNAVLGLATGSTPLGLYREMIRMHNEDGLDFSRVTTFNLDEYVGLAPDHPQSYRRFMQENLFDGLNLSNDRIHVPDGLAKDIPACCQRYEAMIQAAGGIDMQILGVGSDGHIAFNEPTSSLASRTRIKTITDRTRKDNARFFKNVDEVPHHAITMGVGTIMEARICLMMAFGDTKADAVALAVEGPVTSMIPASALQFHPDVRLILDEAAASRLTRTEYYRSVYENKPDWQKF